MASKVGSRTPPPRLVEIRSPRPQSMLAPSSINPILLSRRRTSRFQNHGTVDTVPELRRFNSSGTKPNVKAKPRQSTSQSYGSLDNTSPRRERETMKHLSDFLMSYDPPAHNLTAPPPPSPKKKFGLLRRKQKIDPKSNQFLLLPDTAISAKTRQGVKYIAISIPLEHDYLGKLPPPLTSGKTGTQQGNSSTLDMAPVVVHKPTHNAGNSITPPRDLSGLDGEESSSKRSTWGPGVFTKVITKPGSEEVMLQNGYIHRTSQVYTPTGYVYHDAPERRPMSSPTKAIPSSGPPFKVTLTDNPRTSSLNSVSRPILWRHRSDGPLKVINRTPSPDIKPAYQTHKVIKSISTIHSVATTGTGIRQSLKSTPDSFKTSSSMPPAVFGTAETIDLQSFRGTTSRSSLASPQSEITIRFPLASPVEPERSLAIQSPSPLTGSLPQSSQAGRSEKQSDQATQMNRREKVRAKKEKDLASLRSENSNLDRTNTNIISDQPSSENSPTDDAKHINPPSPNIQPLEPQPHSTKPLSKNSAVLSTSKIMLVADLPPSNAHAHQSDLNLPRPLSPAPSIPSLSRLPRPKFIPAKFSHRFDHGNSAYIHRSTQVNLGHTSRSRAQWQSQKAHRARPNSEPFVYRNLDLEPEGCEGDGNGLGVDLDLDAGREMVGEMGMELGMGVGSSRERELDLRMRIVERDTDVLLRTLGGIAKSFDHLGGFGGTRFGRKGSNGKGLDTRSSVIGMGAVAADVGCGDRGEKGEKGLRKRAATAGMEDSGRDRDMNLVMREIQMAAPRVSEESVRVGKMVREGDGFRVFL
ncbi:hypothetical protein EYC80_006735 [Monilinia laxa]|uniref:Uncharacterized protein n=1 Tax=Monilinia laxa TaxID=61186 RepID=A0A5N6JZ30_MONLA|nr:hypothetical protein EYC80_006735 [Monilinia laxa]